MWTKILDREFDWLQKQLHYNSKYFHHQKVSSLKKDDYIQGLTRLHKILMCSKPDLEISQCAAQVWGLGQSPPEIFRFFRAPYTILAITKY